MDGAIKTILFNIGGRLLDYGVNLVSSPKHTTVQDRIQHLDKLIQTIPDGELTQAPTRATVTEKPGLLPATVTEASAKGKAAAGLTTDETLHYQKREISKELLLLEKHLQQGCKIDSKPCDCCEKHPIAVEGLAQEALGMTSDSVFSDLVQWVREIEGKTTEAASASGKYDKEYPRLAVKARDFRKAIMGTESASALLVKEEKDAEATTVSTKQETSESEG